MATLLRPPLVFDRRQKWAIGFADVPPNLIATTLRADVLTLKQPAFSVRLSDSAPPRIKQVRFWETPNLLTTTLFATTQRALPLGPEQWDDCAPPRKIQVTVDVFPNLLENTLGVVVVPVPLPLSAARADAGAPPRKAQVFAEQQPNTLLSALYQTVLTLSQPLSTGRLDASAPGLRAYGEIDAIPNLLGTTLTVSSPTFTLPLSAIRWFDSAPAPRRPGIEQQVNPVVLQPIPAVMQLHASATALNDTQRFAEQYINALALQPVPAVVRADAGAPPPKAPVRIEAWQNPTLSLSLTTVPSVVGLTQAAADAAITGAGLVTQVSTSYSDTVPAGTVISQSPIGGTIVGPGTGVGIVVSLGVQPASTQQPAGRKVRRRYIVEIDGQDFEVEDAAHAMALLEQAREVALRAAPAIVESVAIKRVQTGKPVHTPAPRISSPDTELATVVKVARSKITDIYRQAAIDAEIRLRLEAKMRADDEDDDDILMLL